MGGGEDFPTALLLALHRQQRTAHLLRYLRAFQGDMNSLPAHMTYNAPQTPQECVQRTPRPAQYSADTDVFGKVQGIGAHQLKLTMKPAYGTPYTPDTKKQDAD
ncbi:hypothetical protein D3C85_1581490 [compost metagenome]